MNFFFQLVLIIGLLVPSLNIYADCVLDNTTTPNGIITPMTTILGQQFLSCETGNINAIQVQTSGGDIDLYLVGDNGSAVTPGTPYQSFTGQAAGLITLNLSTPFPVVNGNLYAFAIGSSTGGFGVFFDLNPTAGFMRVPSAPDGQFHFTMSNTGTFTENNASDLVFGVNIVSPVPPPPDPGVFIPTMSQWGLIILGLLILNLSLISLLQLNFTAKNENLPH